MAGPAGAQRAVVGGPRPGGFGFGFGVLVWLRPKPVRRGAGRRLARRAAGPGPCGPCPAGARLGWSVGGGLCDGRPSGPRRSRRSRRGHGHGLCHGQCHGQCHGRRHDDAGIARPARAAVWICHRHAWRGADRQARSAAHRRAPPTGETLRRDAPAARHTQGKHAPRRLDGETGLAGRLGCPTADPSRCPRRRARSGLAPPVRHGESRARFQAAGRAESLLAAPWRRRGLSGAVDDWHWYWHRHRHRRYSTGPPPPTGRRGPPSAGEARRGGGGGGERRVRPSRPREGR